MKIKAAVGTAVVFFVTGALGNTFIFEPFRTGSPIPGGTRFIPAWASIIVLAVIGTLLLAWVHERVKDWSQTALMIATSQIILTDVYWVLNGVRTVQSAIASAVVLLMIWTFSSFAYQKLNATS